jgi:hypothetical protein
MNQIEMLLETKRYVLHVEQLCNKKIFYYQILKSFILFPPDRCHGLRYPRRREQNPGKQKRGANSHDKEEVRRRNTMNTNAVPNMIRL